LFEYAVSAKWLELLQEIAAGVMRAAVLRDPNVAAGIGQFAAIQTVSSRSPWRVVRAWHGPR
jgi:putative ABC transport system substrate-binding protein